MMRPQCFGAKGSGFSGRVLVFAWVWLAWLTMVCVRADDVATLPGTALLTGPEDLSGDMMDGLHRFIERKIAASVGKRPRFWNRDVHSREAYEASVQPNRERFKKMLGVVDPRVPARLERYATDGLPSPADPLFEITPIRWNVLEGVQGEGVRIRLAQGAPAGFVITLPDADQTPEQLLGLAPGIPPESQFARRLAEFGFDVLVPVLIDRSDEWSGNPQVAFTNQSHREWIYRQACQMGRHVIGYEVQKVLALVDAIRAQGVPSRVGVAGYGEGGLIAFYAAACDTRINACLVSGYFDAHEHPWEEPLYRNLWGLFHEFGDAEIASLIAPRGLVVEYSTAPEITGPPEVRPGRRGGAAAGRLGTPSFAAVEREYHRIDGLVPDGFQTRSLVHGAAGMPVPCGSPAAMDQFLQRLGQAGVKPLANGVPKKPRSMIDVAERQRRQVWQLQEHVQRLVRGSDAVRDRFFPEKANPGSISSEEFAARSRKYRAYAWDEVLGRLDDPMLPLNPRTRQIYNREKWVGYDVTLDLFPDVFAWGVLLLPKDLKPGEKRPVVVCQHGRRGIPRDVIEGNQPAYHDFAARLADEGFIVFAPHNPYRGEDRYRFLSRKANAVKASLFSFILAEHEQILNYLETLPQVDAHRIAFYGLSYGGETAVRVPPLLERYCLSICSADFNDWARKVASVDSPFSFMFTIEWEMPYFDMGQTFNYAELAALMVPRPFMVERGHADGVAPDEWVAYEYAKVRRLYDQLAIGDRTEIEFFNGGHTINGQGTFQFLRKHLRHGAQDPAAPR